MSDLTIWLCIPVQKVFHPHFSNVFHSQPLIHHWNKILTICPIYTSFKIMCFYQDILQHQLQGKQTRLVQSLSITSLLIMATSCWIPSALFSSIPSFLSCSNQKCTQYCKCGLTKLQWDVSTLLFYALTYECKYVKCLLYVCIYLYSNFSEPCSWIPKCFW